MGLDPSASMQELAPKSIASISVASLLWNQFAVIRQILLLDFAVRPLNYQFHLGFAM